MSARNWLCFARILTTETQRTLRGKSEAVVSARWGSSPWSPCLCGELALFRIFDPQRGRPPLPVRRDQLALFRTIAPSGSSLRGWAGPPLSPSIPGPWPRDGLPTLACPQETRPRVRRDSLGRGPGPTSPSVRIFRFLGPLPSVLASYVSFLYDCLFSLANIIQKSSPFVKENPARRYVSRPRSARRERATARDQGSEGILGTPQPVL